MSPAPPFPAPAPAGPVPRVTGPVLAGICGRFFLSRLLFLWVAAFSHTAIFQGPFSKPASSWIERFKVWDSTWYLNIAENGYRYDAHGQSTIAFYPLLPLLIRALHACGLDPLLAGYAISHAALFAAGVLLWRLAALETRSTAAADLTLTLLLLGPGAVWFGLIYTESLFLLTLVGCLLAARRGRWLEAGCWGYAAALTRTPGLFLAGFLCLEAAQQWREQRRDAAASAGPPAAHRWWPLPPFARALLAVGGPVLGQCSFLVFQWVAFGDWRAQQKTTAAGWLPGGSRAPWTALALHWQSGGPAFSLLAGPLLAVVLAAGAASFWTLQRWGYPVLVFTLTALCLGATNGDALVRYCSTLAPVYIVLAQAAQGSRLLETALLSGSVAVFVLLTALLANGYQVL